MKPKTPKDWRCQECGKRLTLNQAEKASFGSAGCPKCGSTQFQRRGSTIALTRRYFRYQCTACGGWFRGTKTETATTKMTNIAAA